jgi:deazaflavin-dependent oxidoreductase (nitroreductase family)
MARRLLNLRVSIENSSINEALGRGHTIDITTRGRKSGEDRRIEIEFQIVDGRIYISGLAARKRRNWLANLEADPHFTFHLKGRVQADLPATARVITEEAERRQILAEVARAWRRDDLDKMVQYSPLVEVTFTQ